MKFTLADVAAFNARQKRKPAPFAVNVFHLDAESIAQGRAENERALESIAVSESLGDWPAYPAQMHTLTLPKWAKAI